jgi:hypothetical protein
MARRRITKRVVDALKVKPAEYTEWDDSLSGFGVRVRPSGSMSYIVTYRAGAGRVAPVRRFTIAAVGKITPEQARQRAQTILGAVAHGRDPAAEKSDDRGMPTVAELADRFMGEHVALKRKKGTTAFYRDILDRIVKPSLGTAKADKVTRAKIARLHGKLQSTPFQANRMLAVVGSMYAFAVRIGVSRGSSRAGCARGNSSRHGAWTEVATLFLVFNCIVTLWTSRSGDAVAWSLVPSAGLSELPGNPFRGGMRGGLQPQKPASVMPQDQKTIEKPERNRRHHEQVHGGDAVGMVAEKGPPAL